MKKNSLLKYEGGIIRILDIRSESVLIIDCIKRTMPKWISRELLVNYQIITEEELQQHTKIHLPNEDTLSKDSRRIATEKNISKQTIRSYLCLYLTYQDIVSLAPMSMLVPKQRRKRNTKELTQDEKNMRWALNKFFYNKNKNSLTTTYTLMLKAKYCNTEGILLPEYPTIHQFRYFYRKTKKLQNYYISRDGIKNYQRNNRPLLGNGVQEYTSSVGTGMLDATVCDIYLVNESGNLVGRPILTSCIDAKHIGG